MKKILLIFLSSIYLFASLDDITSFDADFVQKITDDKKKVLVYKGHIVASKPQNAFWKYTDPIEKNVYITKFQITIVEPEIEQVIIRKVSSDFDFFKMMKNAKKIKENLYKAHYRDTVFTISTKNSAINSISYLDQFENRVKIIFSHQKQNTHINKEIYRAKIPLDYDIIRD